MQLTRRNIIIIATGLVLSVVLVIYLLLPGAPGATKCSWVAETPDYDSSLIKNQADITFNWLANFIGYAKVSENSMMPLHLREISYNDPIISLKFDCAEIKLYVYTPISNSIIWNRSTIETEENVMNCELEESAAFPAHLYHLISRYKTWLCHDTEKLLGAYVHVYNFELEYALSNKSIVDKHKNLEFALPIYVM